VAVSEWEHPDDCGCCRGISVETPVAIDNRPSLERIVYRIGAYADFKESVAARLSSAEHPALSRLRTRANDDFTMALADGFAVMADVLTFYQERIANEAFLRTATDRQSVRELARLLGYELSPSVAAEVWLAFVLEEARGTGRGSAEPVEIPNGTKVQSIPGPDELPQTFETVAPLNARVEHNAIRVQTTEPQAIGPGLRELFVEGTGHQLSAGDIIGVLTAERVSNAASTDWDVRVLQTVETDDRRGYTRVTWAEGLQHLPATADAGAAGIRVFVFRQRAALFGHNAPDPRLLSRTGTNLRRLANLTTGTWFDFDIQGTSVDLDQAYPKILPGSWIVLARPTASGQTAIAPGTVALYRAQVVSHRSRSDFGLAGRVTRIEVDTATQLAGFGLRGTLVLAQSEVLPLTARPWGSPLYRDRVALSAIVRDLAPGRAIAVSGKSQHVRVASGVADLELTLDAGGSAALVPGDRLTLLAPPTLASSGISFDVVTPGLGLTTPGPVSDLTGLVATVPTLVVATHSVLPALSLDLTANPGSTSLLRWRLADRFGRSGITVATAQSLELDRAREEDETRSEVAFIAGLEAAVIEDQARTQLRLAAPLARCYNRESVAINANLTLATHGETVSEVLGSGDASRVDQTFRLKQPPLTRVSADTPSGRRATLDVRVDDRPWTEVDSLFGAAPSAHAYSIRDDESGGTTVQFGDGAEGARLPTGQQNVRATYRKGVGSAGNVRAGQLATLLTRPLGVTGVTNPQPSAGGQDVEALDEARRNAPLTVLTLDRAVSVRDYEDFARGFAGIAKAHAIWIDSGPARGIFLTVAGPAGAGIEPGSKTATNLVAALRKYGDPLLPLRVVSYSPRTFRVEVNVKIGAGEVVERILGDLRTTVESAFSFDRRDFGQPVSIDELIAVIHTTAAIEAVDVNVLRRTDQPAIPAVRPRLFAALPLVKAAAVSPAELLTVDTSALRIGVMP
jgi:hypothetical protein